MIRNLQKNDIPQLVKDFTGPWTTPEIVESRWNKYLEEQKQNVRVMCVIEDDDKLLGYGSLLFRSEYNYFSENNIPEICDVWIGDEFRELGYGTKLIEYLESLAESKGFEKIGIGVGLYEDYGMAQRRYVKLGFIPDGKGVTYKCKPVVPGGSYPVDDDLILWFTKPLS